MGAEAGQEARDKVRRRREERDRSDLLKVLDLKEGRRLLWRIMAEAGTFGEIFSMNALEMSHAAGRRNVGLFVAKQIPTDTFARMQKEAASDKSQEEQELKSELKKAEEAEA
jgi:hypothetical protein